MHYSALKIEEKILNFIPTVTNFMNINIDAQRGGGLIGTSEQIKESGLGVNLIIIFQKIVLLP